MSHVNGSPSHHKEWHKKENQGFKGKTFGTYGVHKNQALVLVNYGGATGLEILQLSQTIQKAIDAIFGIPLEAEVNIL